MTADASPHPPPTALFVYNRPELLDRTLQCLRAAGARELYVFSDGPKTDADETRVEAVRRIVHSIDWGPATVIERERNLGLTESMVSGVGWMLDRFERVAVIEDDVVVAPEFYAFVAQALDRYAADDHVAGVTGLRLPFSRSPLKHYPFDAFMLPRFFSTGWATWRRAWATFEFDRDRLLEKLRAPAMRPELAGADLPRMIRSAVVGTRLAGSWDVYCAASMVVNGQYFVVPTWNMVENTGLASGTHPLSPRWKLRWEREFRPPRETFRFPPALAPPNAIHKSWRVFTENPQGWTWRRLIPRPVRMLLRRMRRTYAIFDRG